MYVSFKLWTVNSYINRRQAFFRKNGKPIIETRNDRQVSFTLQVYDPCSEHFNDLGIRGNFHWFSVSSYTETLLLLDHPSSIIVADDDDGHNPILAYPFTSQCS